MCGRHYHFHVHFGIVDPIGRCINGNIHRTDLLHDFVSSIFGRSSWTVQDLCRHVAFGWSYPRREASIPISRVFANDAN